MAHYFTSDWHFNHGNIIKYCNREFCLQEHEKSMLKSHRDFKVCEESIKVMDAEIIKNINAMAKVDDHIWFLGDFLFANGHEYYRRCENYLSRIECKNIHIVWGNHDDRCIGRLFASTHDLTMLAVRGDDFVLGEQNIHKAKINHSWQKIVLCHYAMAVWEKSHRSVWQLYGHSHSSAEGWLDKNMPGRRSVDVGIDNAAKLLGAYRPFSMQDLTMRFAEKTGFSVDVHGKE